MRVGIDLVEIKRIKLTEKFLEKIANEKEIEYLSKYNFEKNKLQSVAGMWAVKEAVFKCLGLGEKSKVTFKNVELFHEENGKPFVKLNGVALQEFNNLNLKQIDVSISHTDDYATAIAIAI